MLLIAAAFLLGVLLLVLAGIVDRVRSASTEEAGLFAEMHGVATTPDGLELCRRYLSRARHFRFFFSEVGLLLGLMIYRLGIFLVVLVPAWFLGVMATELFRLRDRRASGTPRTASLAPRQARRYVPRKLAWHARIFAAGTVGLAVAGLLLPWHGSRSVLCTVAALAVATIALSESCQWLIAARTRPALPSQLEQADDAIRRVGAKAVGYAASGGLAALFGIECLNAFRSPDTPPHISGISVVVGLVALTWALLLGGEEHRFFWPVGERRRRARRVASP